MGLCPQRSFWKMPPSLREPSTQPSPRPLRVEEVEGTLSPALRMQNILATIRTVRMREVPYLTAYGKSVVHDTAKSMWTPLLISGVGYFSHTNC